VRNRLLWKLVGINAVAIGAVILVVWLAFNILAADYFTVLMDRYHISPDELHGMFLAAVHRYLLWASVAGLAIALVLSYWLTRRVLSPLSRMVDVTRRIAAGDYSARVGARGTDEVARLGRAFDRMAESLARLEQLRRQMVADAAHELRTPLTNIQGYLEALRDGVIRSTPETFAMLHGQVRRLARLADALLDLARADAARADIQRDDLALRPIIEEMIEAARPGLAARKLHVTLELSLDAARVYADPDRLRQVCRNLLQNAAEHAATGGQLQIRSARVETGVRLSFTNDGETFATADAPYIFERFYRADKSRSRGGAGIGLAIVKELIEAQGGAVGAETGGGRTCVWLTLPTAPVEPRATDRAGTGAPERTVAATASADNR
jgi:two-component system sensor histidine kinase BaeS